MKNRTVQYVVWIGGTVLLFVLFSALVLTQTIRASGAIGWGVYCVWTGLLLVLDWCPEWKQWDRWERQVYGLAIIWMGGAMTAICFFSEQPNLWLLLSLAFGPPAIIALVGRLWYVEKKRSQAWKKQNQTEKD